MGTEASSAPREQPVPGETARVRAAVASARGDRTPRTRAVDALAILVSLATVVLGVEGSRGIWSLLPAWWLPVDVGVGVLASVALWWRRRHPVPIAIVLAVLGGLFASAGAAAIIATYTVASLRRTWVALAVTVAHLAIAIPYFFIVPVAGLGPAVWALLMVLLYVTTLAVGLAVRTRRQLIAGLVEHAAVARRQQQVELARAGDVERARIAREMHDVLAHRLTLLSVHAGALEYRTRPGAAVPATPEEMREAVGVIRTSAHVALEELRDVLALLGSGSSSSDELGTGPPQPTVADLEALTHEALAAGQRVTLQIGGHDRLRRAREQLQRTVFRIVQEGLTNARKHAPDTLVEVEIHTPGETIEVRVSNPVPVGVTPTEVPGSRAGLTGLRERIRLDGGSLTAGVHDGSFVLHAALPWRG